MDTHVKGGFDPSSLAALIAALPKLCLNGSVQLRLGCSDDQLKWRVRTNRIAPPIDLGSRRMWLEPEVAEMKRVEDWREVETGAGQRQLDERIAMLEAKTAAVRRCDGRFDFQYVPANSHQAGVQDCGVTGLVNLQAACRSEGSPYVWHRLPYTYGTVLHHPDVYEHLFSRRRGSSRLIRTVAIIEMNMTKAIAQAMAVRAETA